MDSYDKYEKYCYELQTGKQISDSEWTNLTLFERTNDPYLIERCSKVDLTKIEVIESDLYMCGKCKSRRIKIS